MLYLCALYRRLQLYYQRYRSRRMLRALDRQSLSDIGLSRCDAEAEARKPFWHE